LLSLEERTGLPWRGRYARSTVGPHSGRVYFSIETACLGAILLFSDSCERSARCRRRRAAVDDRHHLAMILGRTWSIIAVDTKRSNLRSPSRNARASFTGRCFTRVAERDLIFDSVTPRTRSRTSRPPLLAASPSAARVEHAAISRGSSPTFRHHEIGLACASVRFLPGNPVPQWRRCRHCALASIRVLYSSSDVECASTRRTRPRLRCRFSSMPSRSGRASASCPGSYA